MDTCLENLKIGVFFLFFVDFIILNFLVILLVATKEISSGTGLFSEMIKEVGPLSETIQSRNSFLFFIVAERHSNLIFIGACINISSHVVPLSLSPK